MSPAPPFWQTKIVVHHTFVLLVTFPIYLTLEKLSRKKCEKFRFHQGMWWLILIYNVPGRRAPVELLHWREGVPSQDGVLDDLDHSVHTGQPHDAWLTTTDLFQPLKNNATFSTYYTMYWTSLCGGTRIWLKICCSRIILCKCKIQILLFRAIRFGQSILILN